MLKNDASFRLKGYWGLTRYTLNCPSIFYLLEVWKEVSLQKKKILSRKVEKKEIREIRKKEMYLTQKKCKK